MTAWVGVLHGDVWLEGGQCLGIDVNGGSCFGTGVSLAR